MDDYIELLKKEMNLLDDKDNGQELRQSLKVENLDKKELLKYKIDFLAKHLGHKNLNCMEKWDYFQELIKNCIDMKETRSLFELAKITCIENDSNMKILCVLTDKEDSSKVIYSISDNEDIVQVTQDDIRKQFKEGMRTLSKSREEEFKKILLEEPKQPICFNEQEIGKATINISTKEKDKVDSQMKRLEKRRNLILKEVEKNN